jgi:hypothetical protein
VLLYLGFAHGIPTTSMTDTIILPILQMGELRSGLRLG